MKNSAESSSMPPSSPAPSPLPALDEHLIRLLAADLASAQWTVDRMSMILSPEASAALMRDQRVPALMELERSSAPEAILTRFFIAGTRESASVLGRAFPSLGVEGALRLGLIDEAPLPAGAATPGSASVPGEVSVPAEKTSTAEGNSTSEETGSTRNALYRAAFDLRPHAAVLPAHPAFEDASDSRGTDASHVPSASSVASESGAVLSSLSPRDPLSSPGGIVEGETRGEAAGASSVTHNWWILSDLGEATTGQPLRPDHVLGIGGATTSLLTLTVREGVERALDMGCGCGIQALYLATHAHHVVATDLSHRACEITRFNALLNDVPLDVREGSLYEPVEGETFDLIVTNPPFVITPDSVRGSGLLEYRDGGMQRDALVRTVIRQAPQHLVDGGLLQMLGNWEIPGTAGHAHPWHERLDEWLRDLPVNAWVVQRDQLDPARYVDMWIRDSGGQLTSREEFETTYRQWLEDFRAAGTCAIGMGFIALQRLVEDARPGQRVYDSIEDGRAPRGEDVRRALNSLTLADSLAPLHLICAPDITEERHFMPGTTDPRAIILHQGGGLGQAVTATTALAAAVGASDGELSVGQICAALASILECDADALADELDPQLRRLIRWGFLTPAQETPQRDGK